LTYSYQEAALLGAAQLPFKAKISQLDIGTTENMYTTQKRMLQK
jgi:hypothetical protein